MSSRKPISASVDPYRKGQLTSKSPGATSTTATSADSNSIALAGEFAALSQLALGGYDANLTLGNTKNVDILVSDPNSERMYRLEVKTTGYRRADGGAGKRSGLFGYNFEWLLSEKHEEIDDPSLFYCFVTKQ